MDEIAGRIRVTRQKRHMTLSDLAAKSGVSRGYIHLLEGGNCNPTIDKLTAIARALELTTAELIGEIEVEDFTTTISDSLQQFAQKDNVPVEDIEMLSRINYQGRQPKAIWEWRVIYSVIKSTLE